MERLADAAGAVNGIVHPDLVAAWNFESEIGAGGVPGVAVADATANGLDGGSSTCPHAA